MTHAAANDDVLASVGASFGATAFSGSLLLAVPVVALAGLVSFLSPCVLPLVPGYLSYVTGLAGADLAEARRGRMVAGSALFVVGFSAVFVAVAAAGGTVGYWLRAYQRELEVGLGLLTVALGLMFLGAVRLPFLARDIRVHRWPRLGLAGAPLLGMLFGLGWTPCVGPTLSAVVMLGVTEGGAARAALLGATYSLALGLPFVLAAVAYRRAIGAFGWVRRHYSWVMATGGILLVVLGVLITTGLWKQWTLGMQGWVAGFTVAI